MSTNSARPSKVTRADVARLAGVSPSVVSFTLNGGPRPVAPETADRVREAVRALGYVPNAAARALNLGTVDSIGLIVQDIENPHYSRLVAAVQRAAQRRGLDIVTGTTLEDRSRTQTYLRRFEAAQLQGIILAAPITEGEVTQLEQFRAPIVQLDSQSSIPDIVRIEPAFDTTTSRALDHLFSLGHESVAFIGGASAVDIRFAPWQNAHYDRLVRPGDFAVVPSTRQGGYDGMQRILRTSRPTAVFAGSGVIAVGALRALTEAGIAVPDEVSLVSFDDIPELAFASPPVTAMRLPIDEMAETAVTAIVDPRAVAIGDHLYETEFIDRASTAPPLSIA